MSKLREEAERYCEGVANAGKEIMLQLKNLVNAKIQECNEIVDKAEKEIEDWKIQEDDKISNLETNVLKTKQLQ